MLLRFLSRSSWFRGGMSLEKHTGAVGTRMMCEEEMLRNAYVNLGASFGQKKLTRTINKYTADCELKLKMDREREREMHMKNHGKI